MRLKVRFLLSGLLGGVLFTFTLLSSASQGGGTGILPSQVEPTPSPHPLRTLIPIFDSLLKVDSNCLSPCWWGMTLGQTPAEDFFRFMESRFPEYSERYVPSSGEGVILQIKPYHVDPAGIRIYLTASHGTVEWLQLRYTNEYAPADGIEDYALREGRPPVPYETYLAEVLAAYGVPDEIWLHGGSAFRDVIEVVYNQPKLSVSYVWELTLEEIDSRYDRREIQPTTVMFCLHFQNTFVLNVEATNSEQREWPPEGSLAWSHQHGSTDIQSIEAVTDFTRESFTQAVIDNPELCFEAASEGL